MAELRLLHRGFGVHQEIEKDLLQLLLVATNLRIRFVEMHVNLDAARPGSERAKTHRVLDDGVDVDHDIASVRLAGEQEQVANDSDRPICFALYETHRLELFGLQFVLEEKLGKGGNARQRVVQFVRNAGDQLANGSELFGTSQMLGDLSLLGQVSDADHESDDILVGIANVAERHRGGKLSAVLSPVDVLTGPAALVGGNRGNRLAMRGRRLDDEIIYGKPGDITGVVAVFPDRRAVGVLHLRVNAEYEHRLVHGCQSGGQRALARMRPLFIFTQNQHIDSERHGGCEPKQSVNIGASPQLRRLRCDDQDTQPSVAGDERDGDRRLLRYPIGIVRLLTEIFHERRLFGCPGGANRALLDWRCQPFHLLAGAAGGDAHNGVSIGRKNADSLSAGRNHFLEDLENIVARLGDSHFA